MHDFGGDIDRNGKNLPQVSATSFLNSTFSTTFLIAGLIKIDIGTKK